MHLRRSIVNTLWPEKNNKVFLDLCGACAHGKNYLVFPLAGLHLSPNLLQYLAAIVGIDSEMPGVDAISESDLTVEALGKIEILMRILFCLMLAPTCQMSCRL